MFSYLKSKDGPVIDGLEAKEIVFAENQSEYTPLRTLVGNDRDRRVLSRWEPTPEQRKAIAEGADIYLQLLTFGQPLQPILMLVSDGSWEDWEKISIGIAAEISNG
jgi:hypothetical protein